MGENTAIAWCDHTFNGWVGCTKVSPGCANCYAEALDRRVGGGLVDGTKRLRWGKGAPRTRTKTWGDPVRWNARAAAAGRREKVFCASLADVFDPEVAQSWRDDLWALIGQTPALDWLLLTKRPEGFRAMKPAAGAWPANVWLGVTVENQAEAERRIPLLLAQRAAVRFLSCEPLLGPVDLSHWLVDWPEDQDGAPYPGNGFDWCIIGGESGVSARPFDLAWARSLVGQCRAAGVAPFTKQLGARPCDTSALSPHHPMALRLRDRAGANLAEWPADLRVREFPEVRR